MLLDESMSNLSPSFILCFFAVPIAMATSTNKAPSSYQAIKMCRQPRHSVVSRCIYEKKNTRVESFGILKSCGNDIQLKVNIYTMGKKRHMPLLKQQAKKVFKN